MLRGLCCGGVPVEFLTDEEAARYGRYSGPLSRPVLEKLFYLDDEDRRLIERRHRPHLMLGFAVQLVTVRYLGTFLNDPLDVPTEVIHYVAEQLGIKDPSCVKRYTERRPTRFEHQEEIRRAYGLRDFAAAEAELAAWIDARAWTTGDGPKAIFTDAVAWLRERGVVLRRGVLPVAGSPGAAAGRAAMGVGQGRGADRAEPARRPRPAAGLPGPAARYRLPRRRRTDHGRHRRERGP